MVITTAGLTSFSDDENCVMFLFSERPIFLATCVATMENFKQSVASCSGACYLVRSRIATCNGLKNSVQLLQKLGLRSTLCSRLKPKEVGDKLPRGHVTTHSTCSLSYNAVETQVPKKIASWSTSLRVSF